MRNDKGQFLKGRRESREEKLKRIQSLSASWKERKDYIQDIKHPKIYNCWRAILFTQKGKRIGYSEAWKDYRTFYIDVASTYQDAFVLTRMDKSAPFSKDNFIWLDKFVANNTKDNNILLTWNGETKSLRQWALESDVSLAAIRLRYHRHKEYTPEEIILGKKVKRRRVIKSASELAYQKVRDKASKMCASYRHKDRRRRWKFDLTIEWLMEHILYKKCVYCGSELQIGCDRIDNNKGHTKDNVVPCCIVCNIVRGKFFSFEEMKILGVSINRINDMRQSKQ